MLTKIKKWGNSQGVRIPKAFLDNLKISEDDEVEIVSDQEKIVIQKVSKPEHLSLKERLEQFYNQPIEEVLSNKRGPSEEVDWGKPMGKEVW
ncbi:AbrB/MazE/SpoVT family DNA-binding domain-containing protein [bacterium]|nr:AbrB/MazE/SpoVT family DNA-binding domain-containing protein [bacterium]